MLREVSLGSKELIPLVTLLIFTQYKSVTWSQVNISLGFFFKWNRTCQGSGINEDDVRLWSQMNLDPALGLQHLTQESLCNQMDLPEPHRSPQGGDRLPVPSSTLVSLSSLTSTLEQDGRGLAEVNSWSGPRSQTPRVGQWGIHSLPWKGTNATASPETCSTFSAVQQSIWILQ